MLFPEKSSDVAGKSRVFKVYFEGSQVEQFPLPWQDLVAFVAILKRELH